MMMMAEGQETCCGGLGVVVVVVLTAIPVIWLYTRLRETVSGLVAREGQRKGVPKNWEGMASSAWEDYTRSGRGAVFEGYVRHRRGTTYFSKYALPSSDYGNPAFNARVRQLLEEYDPEREIVVVSVRDRDLTVDRHCVEGPGQTPPECYERRKKAEEESSKEGGPSTTLPDQGEAPVRDAPQTPSTPATLTFVVGPAGVPADSPSILGWDTLPSELSEISAAMERTRSEGPSAMARLAFLCLCYRHRKAHAEVTHQAEGRFLHDFSILWYYLATQVPRDLECLPGTNIPLQPQIPRELAEERRGDDVRAELPAQFSASTARRGLPNNARAREQRRWLQRFMDSGDYELAWQVLEHIQQTLLDEDWDFYDIMGHQDFHKFRYRLLETVETLQPHTDAHADEIYAFISDLLVEGAETIPGYGSFTFDRFCRLVSCVKWFLQHWTAPGELGQLMDLVWTWQSRWPGLAMDVFGSERSITGIQMRRRGDPEWGDNWLGERAFWLERSVPHRQTRGIKVLGKLRRRSRPKLKPHQDCIPKGMGRAFYWALPHGDGHYEFRAMLEGTSDVIETSAHISSDQPYNYAWIPGQGPIEVGPAPHGASSWLIVDEVITWRPDIGAIPLRSISRSAYNLVEDPVQETYPGVVFGD